MSPCNIVSETNIACGSVCMYLGSWPVYVGIVCVVFMESPPLLREASNSRFATHHFREMALLRHSHLHLFQTLVCYVLQVGYAYHTQALQTDPRSRLHLFP